MTNDPSSSIKIERAGLAEMLTLFAVARETAEEAKHDARDAEAAAAIMRIAETMDQIGDDVVAKLASVDRQSQGLLSALIAARLLETGFALPCYADAKEFLAPIEATVDKIMHDARQHMH